MPDAQSSTSTFSLLTSTLPRTSGIYAIECSANGKRYVGSAVDFRARLKVHRTTVRAGKHHSPLFQRAFLKYGEDAFLIRVIESCPPEQLIAREQYWIDFHRAADQRFGFNIHPNAASPLGRKLSEEQKRRIGDFFRGKTRRFSEEHRRNLSQACMGRPTSERQRLAVSAANRGKTVTAATRELISVALRGKAKTPEHVARLPQNSGGENHPRARFTWEQVRVIRRRCETERTCDVARDYGVKAYVISQIKHGHTWKTQD